MTFSIARYSREAAIRLSAEFCRRGNSYIALWIEAPEEPPFGYTNAHVAACAHDIDFLGWVVALDVTNPFLIRRLRFST